MNILYEKTRLCSSNSCNECPLNVEKRCVDLVLHNPDEAERLIREWAEAHPEQTYKSYFLERFPNAIPKGLGVDVPSTCVMAVYGLKHRPEKSCLETLCADCWNRPYKEDV